jgi:formylglycine-generating enzyme required for sulfatase activity
MKRSVFAVRLGLGVLLAAAAFAQKPGDIKINPDDGQRYVWIPAGDFMMGCSPGDADCQDNEKPAHRVRITRGFWMGQTETTVAAWKRYVSQSGASLPPEIDFRGYNWNPGWMKDDLPIVNLLWDEAQNFCRAAGGRLPTEAEWEYAARGGAKLPVARYGDPDEIAWFGDDSGVTHVDSEAIYKNDRANFGDRVIANRDTMHPVAQKKPNAWGLHDMLGNADEWVADWYDPKYYDQRAEIDPQGPQTGENKVARGVGFGRHTADLRASFRRFGPPGTRNNDFGVRCVRIQIP